MYTNCSTEDENEERLALNVAKVELMANTSNIGQEKRRISLIMNCGSRCELSDSINLEGFEGSAGQQLMRASFDHPFQQTIQSSPS